MGATLKIIARIHTDFPSKFGIPRQSGLADTHGFIKEKHGIPWLGLPGWEETREWGYSPHVPHSGPILSGCPA